MGLSTSWFMTTPKISERKMSVMEKQIPIASNAKPVSTSSRYHVGRKENEFTFHRSFQTNLSLRLVQENHKLCRCQQLTLPYTWKVRADAAEGLWGCRNDR